MTMLLPKDFSVLASRDDVVYVTKNNHPNEVLVLVFIFVASIVVVVLAFVALFCIRQKKRNRRQDLVPLPLSSSSASSSSSSSVPAQRRIAKFHRKRRPPPITIPPAKPGLPILTGREVHGYYATTPVLQHKPRPPARRKPVPKPPTQSQRPRPAEKGQPTLLAGASSHLRCILGETAESRMASVSASTAAAPEPTDAKNKFEDLSGVVVQPDDNPYQALIAACDDDPARMQAVYATHRTTRNAQQRAAFLDPAFDGILVDQILRRIEDPSIDPSFADPRHGLVFWARPPEHILQLAAHLQAQLQLAAPHLWLMPLHRMHMTALEIVHSRTPDEAYAVVQTMARATIHRVEDGHKNNGSSSQDGNGLAALVNYPYRHRARLVKPLLSYDRAAVALSFLPAAGEPHASPPPVPPSTDSNDSQDDGDDAFTYHHLRRDLLNRARATGVAVASRYVVPSAHITLARFLDPADHATAAARQAWVAALDGLNARLERDVWTAQWTTAPTAATASADGSGRLVGEWVVGQERGLDARTGALWYGGGRSVMVGEGF
ncbi:RNA ligase/cyclic nucleotide phosphodiesterase [Niveomyces insectorum RCEF 264]|uniref:RNA ligase/cyclic nucleotide phosphodiesterase n=1 Tax=Niveomyces insectorum RCEF 264 TaxID=1081102 RepID=A0A162JBR7_9HYPO|nr:RNA ligase/cyclic nucleotide phosphodiesterase [Niveomyces insectorum RCEF 264]